MTDKTLRRAIHGTLDEMFQPGKENRISDFVDAILAIPELQEAQRDAERLDWVLNQIRLADLYRMLPDWDCAPANLRAAIDAARKGEG